MQLRFVSVIESIDFGNARSPSAHSTTDAGGRGSCISKIHCVNDPQERERDATRDPREWRERAKRVRERAIAREARLHTHIEIIYRAIDARARAPIIQPAA